MASGISKRFYRRISQDVCPWNVKFSRDVTDSALLPAADRVSPDIDALQRLDDAEFAAPFGASAITRTKRRGLVRNAEVVLENRRALTRP